MGTGLNYGGVQESWIPYSKKAPSRVHEPKPFLASALCTCALVFPLLAMAAYSPLGSQTLQCVDVTKIKVKTLFSV